MRSPNRLPAHRSTELPPRQSKARYYGHRVHQSLSGKVGRVVSEVFLSGLLVVGILCFVLWLSLRPHRPSFYIEDFSATHLDRDFDSQTTKISFNVTVRNSNQQITFNYGPIVAAVYYKYYKLGSKLLLESFEQEAKNTTVMADTLSGDSLTVDSTHWWQIVYDRIGGAVLFRVEITTTIRFQVSTWDKRHHRLHAYCDVGLDRNGDILAGFGDKICPLYFI